ncbi:MAG: NADH:flavin oxidoreductase [Firmicutes bacterium]|nr:NADH:flavin oxidoreductase [Bacillota bacterium]
MSSYPRIASFRDAQAFAEHVKSLGADLPIDDEIIPGSDSPMAAPLVIAGREIGNRWCVHPMEGWDGTPDGHPSELTQRRWRRFGESGAKLIWGGEAVAVRHDGRANPNQLRIGPDTARSLEQLRQILVDAHRERHGTTDDLLIGVQLTHSGRFCRPNEHSKPEPRILYHHPLLDARAGIDPQDDRPILSDMEIDDLIGDFVAAAKLAQDIGFDFVDVKACHGYLGHEFLSAFTRPGPYGGSLENRMAFLRETIRGIQRDCPGLIIGVRLSAFDSVPYRPGAEGRGEPERFDHCLPYHYAFGCNPDNPLEIDLTEPVALLKTLRDWGVAAVNISGGSPYYNPHIQRPALFPPSDAYQPPEDPLVGVIRQIDVARQLKEQVPDLPMVGSGYTYLQDYLPHVAQAVVRAGWIDSVGLGRMILSYPHLPTDCFEGQLDRKAICRTFSDCTTAPRHGMVSGCYPLDPFYRERPERAKLISLKKK